MRNFLAKNYINIIAFIIPFGIFLLTTFIEPRPYYLSPIDVEHGYYYGSRLLFFGTPVVDVTHPGTPVQYLGKYFFYITGTDFSQTQNFLNIGYFVIALCTGLAISFFAAKVLRGVPSGIALLALATVFSNPTILTTSNIFGADAFLLAFSTLAATFFWLALGNSNIKQVFNLFFLTGIGVGLVLATKLSSVPFAISIIAVSWLHITLTKMPLWKRLAGYSIVPAASAISFVLFTLPIFKRLPGVFSYLVGRKDVIPSWGDCYQGLLSLLSTGYLIPLLLLGMATALGFIYIALRNLAQSSSNVTASQTRYLNLPRTLLLILFLFSLGYSFTAIKADVDPGVSLRNLVSLTIFFPLAVVCFYHFLLEKGKSSRVINPSSIIVGIVVLCISIGGYMNLRRVNIAQQGEQSSVTKAYLSQYATQGSRIAIWNGSPGNALGEEAFHFWGNYRYARNVFDEFLLDYYPGYTFFKLRQVPDVLNELSKRELSKSEIEDWLFTSRHRQIQIGLIAFPEKELIEMKGASLNDLVMLIEKYYGRVDVREVEIQNVKWILLILNP